MTRINCVPPCVLTDKALGAEYRELPRVFKLVRGAIARGESPDDKKNPRQYQLGTGHVRFFYPRLGYLLRRQREIVLECKKRGRITRFDKPDNLARGIPDAWLGDWYPNYDAVMENINRLEARGGLRL